jgi:hypothetical protein
MMGVRRGNPSVQPKRSLLVVHAVLAALFIVVQATALAHEIKHVTHQHDAPCGLHVVADHLAMAPAPEPALAVVVEPLAAPLPASLDAVIAPPPRCSEARAPPVAA